jgi:hypothetical protein
MAKGVAKEQVIAQKAACDALKELIRLMRDSDNEMVRLAAACEILDRACGKAI